MIEIRPAAASDVDAVTALFLRCWRESYAGFLPGRVVAVFDESNARELWLRALEMPRPGTQGFVAVTGAQVVGITRLGADPDEPTSGHVFSLYVDPSIQGQGFGRLLLETADRWFAAEGKPDGTLWVFEANAEARGFYARHGWQPDGGSRVEAEFGETEIRLRHKVG